MCCFPLFLSQLWSEVVRLGEVGGNTLGFLGCTMAGARGKRSLLAYGFNGSLHLWEEAEAEGSSWDSGVVAGGHFGPVEDLDWEAEEARSVPGI